MYVISASNAPELSVAPTKKLISERSAELNLLLALGYAAENLPYADLMRQIVGLSGRWIVLTPVQFHASHNDLFLVDTYFENEVEFPEDIAKTYFSIVSDYFASEGFIFYYYNATTWLVHDLQNRPLNSKPPHCLYHQSLVSELARLDDTLFWQKFITECQMLFASKPSATQINGLWPWSTSILARKKNNRICAEKPFFTMAQLCSTSVTEYVPMHSLRKQDLLLIRDFNALSTLEQNYIKKHATHWYWNNMAYKTNANHWFSRIWRAIVHAY